MAHETLLKKEVLGFLDVLGLHQKYFTDRFPPHYVPLVYGHPARQTTIDILNGHARIHYSEYKKYQHSLCDGLQRLLDETRKLISRQLDNFRDSLLQAGVEIIQASELSQCDSIFLNRSKLLAGRSRWRRNQVEEFFAAISPWLVSSKLPMAELQRWFEKGEHRQPAPPSRFPLPAAVRAVLKKDRDELTPDEAEQLTSAILEATRSLQQAVHEQAKRLEDSLRQNCRSVLNERNHIDRSKWEAMYEQSWGSRPRPILIEGTQSDDMTQEQAEQIIRAVQAEIVRLKQVEESLRARIVQTREGNSTIVVFEFTTNPGAPLTEQQKELIQLALQNAGMSNVHETDLAAIPSLTRRLLPEHPWTDPDEPDSPARFVAGWRSAIRWDRLLIRPLRRLRWLFSRAVRSSPLAHVISQSDERAYATAARDNWQALKTDLRMVWIQWPLLTILLLTSLLGAIRLIDQRTEIALGIITAVGLYLTGAQLCSTVISPLAAGAGGIGLGLSFGLAHAIILGRFGDSELLGQAAIREDFFTAITGGIVGLTAPLWHRGMAAALMLFLLFVVAFSIAAAAFLMGQPKRASASPPAGRPREWLGVLSGVSVGGCIGLVQLGVAWLNTKQVPTGIAFTSVFTLTGSMIFALSVWLRTNDLRRSKMMMLVAAYVFITVSLCFGVWQRAGDGWGLVALSAASAWYHATWFTGAFVIAEKIGSVRAAIVAASLEGAVGFTAFAASRITWGGLGPGWKYSMWMAAGFVWLAIWLSCAARRAAAKHGDGLVNDLSRLLPPFVLTTCLAAFALAPARNASVWQFTLWSHHVSFMLLFLFLAAAQYFQIEARWRIRREDSTRSVALTYRRLWILTEMAPAPIALAIFLSGLRLMWEMPDENSPDAVWLLGLVLAFSVFFWDGVLGYQPIVRNWYRYWSQAAERDIPVNEAARSRGQLAERLQLLAHFLSWPFVFVLGVFRWDFPNAITSELSLLMDHLRFLPQGWPEVVTALLLWASTGLLVLLFRRAFRAAR
jgi:hypothetical protein